LLLGRRFVPLKPTKEIGVIARLRMDLKPWQKLICFDSLPYWCDSLAIGMWDIGLIVVQLYYVYDNFEDVRRWRRKLEDRVLANYNLLNNLFNP
jgi:hypothetical protein